MAERARIVGTEMEWPVTIWLVDTPIPKQLEGEDGLTKLLAPENLPAGMRYVGAQSNRMLQNGARFYADVGSRVEYAAPETTSYRTAVMTEMAGEQIVGDALRKVVHANDKIQQAILSKRVIDDERKGWGYHINLSADRRRLNSGMTNHSLEASAGLLCAHLATSQALFGAGVAYKPEIHKPLQYSLGQKILSMTCDITDGTTGYKKPFISTRDEPHADKELYRRLHIVGVDPHISPRASWMQLGSLSLVTSVIEQHPELRDAITFSNSPASALAVGRRVAHDLTFRELFELQDGRNVRAHDVQTMLVDAADRLYEMTDEQAEVLSAWKQDVDTLRRDPMSLSHSDAIAKLALIQRHMERSGHATLDEDADAARFIDINYSTVCHVKKTDDDTRVLPTLASKVRNRYFSDHMPSVEDIQHYVYNPPSDTRAAERGRLIREGLVESADWTNVKLRTGRCIKLNDPYCR